MDPAVIAALSGAPSAVVLLYVILILLRDRRQSEGRFLKAIGRLEVTIRRQSALLLGMMEVIAPGRAAQIEANVKRLFDAMPDGADAPSEE